MRYGSRKAIRDLLISRLYQIETMIVQGEPLEMKEVARRLGVSKNIVDKYQYKGYLDSERRRSGRQGGWIRIVKGINWEAVT
jgi:Mn-dependent DtxR family transcriptional regulator